MHVTLTQEYIDMDIACVLCMRWHKFRGDELLLITGTESSVE
jgi:hypothetical protein